MRACRGTQKSGKERTSVSHVYDTDCYVVRIQTRSIHSEAGGCRRKNGPSFCCFAISGVSTSSEHVQVLSEPLADAFLSAVLLRAASLLLVCVVWVQMAYNSSTNIYVFIVMREREYDYRYGWCFVCCCRQFWIAICVHTTQQVRGWLLSPWGFFSEQVQQQSTPYQLL